MGLRRAGLIVLFALCAHVSTAAAQEEIPRPVRNRMLGWSALAGTAALALSAGGAALAGLGASDGCSGDDWCVVSDKMVVAFSVGVVLAATTVPLSTASALHLTGTKHGRTRGGFGMAYLASLSTFAVAGTLSLVSIAALGDSELSAGGATTLTVALVGATLFATAGFGYLAFRRRDRRDSRRADAALIPMLSPRAAGLSWSVRY